MRLPDSIARFVEPEWARLIPPRSVLVIERDDGSIEVHSTGKGGPWNNGAGLAAVRESISPENKRRRLRAALRLLGEDA